MPFVLPTLGELRRLVRDDIAAHLPGADASVPNSNLRAIAEAEAGLAMELVEYIRRLSRELLPDTAEEFLDRHADLWLPTGRKEATYAAGVVRLTGTTGVVVPALTRFAGVTGVDYQTTADVTLAAGPVEVPVEAVVAGAIGNLAPGSALALTVAVPGLNGVATVASMAGGTDAESDDLLRERVLDRIKNPPHGGNANDWEQWAKEVPGVTRAWVSPNEMGVGTVTVRVMLDTLRASSGGFPEPDDLAAVRAHIEEVRPVAVRDWWALAPIAQPLTIPIKNLNRYSAAVKASIEQNLRQMLNGRQFVDALGRAQTVPGRAAPGQTIYGSWIAEAVSQATGEEHHDLTYGNYVMQSPGHIATLGTITYPAGA